MILKTLKSYSKNSRLKDDLKTAMRMQKLADERKSLEFKNETLKAILKNNLTRLVMNGFTKTKKLTKSFFDKPVNIGHNIF